MHWDLAILIERMQDLQGALREAKLALACQPMLSMHYSKVASLAGTLMVDALHRGDQAAAKPLADELVALGVDVARVLPERGGDDRLGSEAEVWLYALYELRGQTQTKALLENKPSVRFRNANPVYRVLQTW